LYTFVYKSAWIVFRETFRQAESASLVLPFLSKKAAHFRKELKKPQKLKYQNTRQ
jgi:hypothetical protein